MKKEKKFFTMTKLIVCICTLLSLIALAGCGNSEKTASANKGPIKVGTLSIADALPLYVAEKKGFFKEEGLTVQIIPFKSSSAESQAMSAGDITIMMNDMVVQSLLKKSGTNTKIMAMALGATPQEGRFVIVGAPGHNYTNPKDLVGKKIAISKNTMMEYLTDRYLTYNHVDPKKVTYVNMPNLLLRMETLLSGKTIDAAILPDPLATIALKKGGTPIIDDTKLPINASQSVILGASKWLKNDPEGAKKFLAAYNKAIKEINTHPQEYKPLLIKIGHVPAPLAATYKMPTFTAGAVPTNGEINALQQWLVQKKLIDKAYTPKELVYKP